MAKSKKIFIAATGQNVGKTTNAVGLFSKLKTNGIRAGFIKPVGQRYVELGDIKVDEDSFLLNKVFDLDFNLKDMNPIAVPRGFTEDYIKDPQPKSLMQKINESFERVAEKSDFVVIEGTGHAGVGSVFDASNAQVAKMLNSKVILVTNGGIGNAIDQLILNKSLFDHMQVEIMGVIINKVHEEKYEKIKEITERGLKRFNLKLLGVVPYKHIMEYPSMAQLREIVEGEFITGRNNADKLVQNIIVGAMSVSHILSIVKEDTLIITPGDREDIILAALSHSLSHQEGSKNNFVGIIITGSIQPSPEVLKIIMNTQIPIILCPLDTFDCASQIHDLKVKIQVDDLQKIEISQKLFDQYVDYNYILDNS